MASGCRRASSAVAHFGHAFAAGWLEAASLCASESEPVLLVGFDTGARGALASVNRSQGLLAVALVLAPRPGPATLAQVDWTLGVGAPASNAAPAPATPAAPALTSGAAQALAGNAMADALPLFEALARLPLAASPEAVPADVTTTVPLSLPLGPGLALSLRLQHWHAALRPAA
jgi:hypothetical protein